MRKGRLLLPVLLLSVVPMAGQQEEHAPTPAQCQADVDLWGFPKVSPNLPIYLGSLDNFLDNFFALNNGPIKVKTMRARIVELALCRRTDASNSGRYHLAALKYGYDIGNRENGFIGQHNLTQQFYEEEDQGKR